jgi:hypothetical protein
MTHQASEALGHPCAQGIDGFELFDADIGPTRSSSIQNAKRPAPTADVSNAKPQTPNAFPT